MKAIANALVYAVAYLPGCQTLVNGKPAGRPQRKSDRTHALLDVEAEIDKLLFQVMGIGELPEVETALREARRRVYRAFSS